MAEYIHYSLLRYRGSKAIMKRLVELVNRELPGKVVVSLGCGAGLPEREFSEVIGLDLENPNTLAQIARENVKDYLRKIAVLQAQGYIGLYCKQKKELEALLKALSDKKCCFVVADMRKIPLRKESIGALAEFFSAQYVNPTVFLKEAQRVLPMGGYLLLTSLYILKKGENLRDFSYLPSEELVKRYKTVLGKLGFSVVAVFRHPDTKTPVILLKKEAQGKLPRLPIGRMEDGRFYILFDRS